MSKEHIKHFIPYIPLIGILTITALVTTGLRILPTKADVVSTITITVNPACTLTSSEPSSGTSSLMTNMYYPDIYSVDLTSSCNDVYDSQIFAVGYTDCDDSNAETCTSISNVDENGEPNNTKLLSSTGAFIPGSTPFQTDTSKFTKSGWFMKVTPDSTNNWPFITQNDFNEFHAIPNTSTLIAKTTSTTNQYTNPVSNLNTTYSAYIDGSQTAGSYTGKVKYTLMSTPSTLTKYYMQNFTLDQCPEAPMTVYDLRDENDYQVAKINGVCWMVQNLRFIGDTATSTMTLDPATSNVDTLKTLAYYSLDKNDANFTNHCENANAANFACVKDSGSKDTGTWYNFPAASAGYVMGISIETESNYDICPAGWHLPTGPYSTSGMDGYSVFQSTAYNQWIPEADAPAPLKTYFEVTGYYYNGGFGSEVGRFWSTTKRTDARYRIVYSINNGFYSDYGSPRIGIFARCVRTS